MTSMEKAINLGYVFLTLKPEKKHINTCTTICCMYWYVSINSEECFWPQYMYSELIPNKGYRWCPLRKLSNLGLEQLITRSSFFQACSSLYRDLSFIFKICAQLLGLRRPPTHISLDRVIYWFKERGGSTEYINISTEICEYKNMIIFLYHIVYVSLKELHTVGVGEEKFGKRLNSTTTVQGRPRERHDIREGGVW